MLLPVQGIPQMQSCVALLMKAAETSVVKWIYEIGASWFVPIFCYIQCSKSYWVKIELAPNHSVQSHCPYFGRSVIHDKLPLFQRSNESLSPLPCNTLNVDELDCIIPLLSAPFTHTYKYGVKKARSAPMACFHSLPLSGAPTLAARRCHHL